ncbi:GNAT family N-acetyltransferase [bacterium]|nr:GNAT family N-acetyltransferase [bacterium]
MNIIYRDSEEKDLEQFDEILSSSGFFYESEIEEARGFLKYNLEDGPEDSGINYIMAEADGKLVGFVCFGFDYCTESSYLLYWIAVHGDFRGKKIGSELLKRFEEWVKAKGGKKIVLETAGRELYNPTRIFYERHGYTEQGVVPDYYSKGDARVTFVKDIA